MTDKTIPVGTLAHRLVGAIIADEKHPDGCDVTAGLFGTELTKLVVELAGQEAELFAVQDQRDEVQGWYDQAMCASNEAGFAGVDAAATIRALADDLKDAKERLEQHAIWAPKVEALTHFLSQHDTGGNWGANVLDVALAKLTEAVAVQAPAADDQGYSPNTIYHVGTDEAGKVIARGVRSTSDAHKDFHVMHAALEFSQAYALRGVVFPEQQIGGLLVRPATEKPKTGNVLKNVPSELTVTADALYRVLNALAGPAHHIRELQATRGLPGDTNPIDTLAVEYQRWFIAQKAEGAQS